MKGIYDDVEFESLMASINWKLPYNVKVYHFNCEEMQKEKVVCNNPVIRERPEIELNIEELLNNRKDSSVKMKVKGRDLTYRVINKCDEFVVLDNGEDYPKVCSMDDDNFSMIADLQVIPMAWKKAKKVVDDYHRHNVAPQGHKYSIGLLADQELVGVLIASEPKAKSYCDGFTLELNRNCVYKNIFNACSKLYAQGIQAGKAMGYRRFITYTLPEESGASLRAVGFRLDGIVPASPSGWNTPSRPRKMPDRYPTGNKYRWILEVA